MTKRLEVTTEEKERKRKGEKKIIEEGERSKERENEKFWRGEYVFVSAQCTQQNQFRSERKSNSFCWRQQEVHWMKLEQK